MALPFDERAPAPLVLPPPQENRGLNFPVLPRYKVCLQWDNTGAFRDSSGVNATAFVNDVSPASGLQVTFQWPDSLGQTGSSSRYLDNDGCATLTFTTLRFVPSYISVYATSRFGTPGTAPVTSPSDAFFELNPVAGQSLSFTTAGTSSRTISMPAGIASRIGAVVSRVVTMVDGLPPITSWTPYGGTTTAPIYWATTISDLPSAANCNKYQVAANATATSTTERLAEGAAGGAGACFGMLLARSTTTGNYYPLAAPGDAFASPTSSVTFERTTIGHELGHVVQARTFGFVDVNYPTSSVLTDGTDPNSVCNCQHVGTGNSRHCLQGRMNYGPAFNEGFAHYFAARVFNEERSGASGSGVCTFPYYKDVKYESWNIAHPPVAINCATPGGMLNGVPTGWQRARCNKPVVGGDYTGEQATEWDFLTFLWSLSSGKPASSTYPYYMLPADAITFTDVQSLVKGACNSGDVNQTFLCTLSSPFNWGTLEAAGLNKWGVGSARFNRLSVGGFINGVDGAP